MRAARALSIAVLLLAAAPYAAGFLFAPRGMVFLGALNNVGDTGQYLAAIRQGGEGHILYTNQYTSLRVAPALMYPLYTVAGLFAAPFHTPAMATYQLLHLLAAVALLAALWRFCRAALPSTPTWLPYTLALCGGGLYGPALLLSGLIPLPFAPAALTAPEYSVFATLLISPHGAAGLAAELWALSGYLAWRRHGNARRLGGLAAGGLLLGLCYPFGLVILLAVVGGDTFLFPHPQPLSLKGRGEQSLSPSPASGRGGWGVRAITLLALLPAGAIALYYAVLFRYDPLWSGSNMLRLPAPSVAVLAAAFGPLILAALPAARRLLSDRAALRHDDGLRLVMAWAAATPLLLVAPIPQAERLLSGWSVALAIFVALALRKAPRRAALRAIMAFSCSNAMLALLYLTVTLHGANPAYYASSQEEGAVRWLAAHTGLGDVVMASAGSGNLIVAAAPCRVVAGQNFETFQWAAAQRDVLRYYASATDATQRAAIMHRRHVTFVVAGPYEGALGRYVPHGTGYRLAYQDGPVRVFRVVA